MRRVHGRGQDRRRRRARLRFSVRLADRCLLSARSPRFALDDTIAQTVRHSVIIR